MIDFLALLFASGVGFGLSCWIFGTVLEKSNNIGDYRGMKSDYRAYVHFRMRKDKMSKGEYESFPRMYAIKLDDSAAPRSAPSNAANRYFTSFFVPSPAPMESVNVCVAPSYDATSTVLAAPKAAPETTINDNARTRTAFLPERVRLPL